MAEEFKNHLDSFLIELFNELGVEKAQNYQEQYEKLIDELTKNEFIPKEKTMSIIESSLSESAQQISKLKEEKNSLTKQNSELNEKNKLLSIKNEQISQKLTFLENSLSKSSNELKNKNALEQKLKDIQTDRDYYKSKYNASQDELSICKKDLKKYYSMEITNKQLTDENEKLSLKISELSSDVNYKMKFEEITQINEKIEIENKNLNKQNYKSNQELESLKNELKQVK